MIDLLLQWNESYPAHLNDSGQVLIYHNGIESPPSTETVSPDEWHTIGMIREGTVSRLILDGVEVTSDDYTTNYGDDRSFVSYNGSNGTSFMGHLRNLKIYDGVEESLPVERTTLDAVKALYR